MTAELRDLLLGGGVGGRGNDPSPSPPEPPSVRSAGAHAPGEVARGAGT